MDMTKALKRHKQVESVLGVGRGLGTLQKEEARLESREERRQRVRPARSRRRGGDMGRKAASKQDAREG